MVINFHPEVDKLMFMLDHDLTFARYGRLKFETQANKIEEIIQKHLTFNPKDSAMYSKLILLELEIFEDPYTIIKYAKEVWELFKDPLMAIVIAHAQDRFMGGVETDTYERLLEINTNEHRLQALCIMYQGIHFVHHQANDVLRMKKSLIKSTEVYPKLVAAYLELGKIAVNEKDHELAKQYYHLALTNLCQPKKSIDGLNFLDWEIYIDSHMTCCGLYKAEDIYRRLEELN